MINLILIFLALIMFFGLVFYWANSGKHYMLGVDVTSRPKKILMSLASALILIVASLAAGATIGMIKKYLDRNDKLISDYLAEKSIVPPESGGNPHRPRVNLYRGFGNDIPDHVGPAGPYVIVKKNNDRRIAYELLYYSGGKFNKDSLEGIRTVIFAESYLVERRTYVSRGAPSEHTREGMLLHFYDMQARQFWPGTACVLAPPMPESTHTSPSQFVSDRAIIEEVKKKM